MHKNRSFIDFSKQYLHLVLGGEAGHVSMILEPLLVAVPLSALAMTLTFASLGKSNK